jgi:hypothetical protein
MKIILVFFSALMLLLSCKKSNNRQPSDLPVQGNWELRQSIGGLVGIQNFAPGNGNILELHADKTFKFVYPDSQFTTGKYQVINIIFTNKNLLHLDFDSTSYTDITDSVKISGTQMTLFVPFQCCDIPYSSVYEKIK